jgi:hypothetical protein
MVKAMQEFKAVQQSAENRFANYRYETYSDIVNAVMPALLKAGIRVAFYPGWRRDEETLTCKLKCQGQWEAATVALKYPTDRKTGQPQDDGQGQEAAQTYARKCLLRSLTACWVAGPDAAVEQDQAAKNLEDAEPVEERPVKRKGKAPLIEQIRSALLLVKHSPVALKEKLAKAEQFAIDGKITEEELVALQQEFTVDDNTPASCGT